MSVSNDGSESVDQFLARIASIKGGRDEVNEANRRMDEEFLKGRQERQARRLERARSISPSKTGPAKTSSLVLDSSTTASAVKPPVEFAPPSASLSRSNAVSGRTSPTREPDPAPIRSLPSPPTTEIPTESSTGAAGLARSGTLSWQQRPASKDSARQRPLSGFASVRNLPRQSPEYEKQDEPSRSDIAASLAQKDPAWFRQTQDRGLGSAAFRKNQVEDTVEPSLSTSMQLPGMAQSREPTKSPSPEDRRGGTPNRETVAEGRDMDRFKRGTTPDITALRNSIAEKPPSLRPNSQDTINSRPLSTDNLNSDESTPNLLRTSSALSQNRPISPTKGLGGFVESAMMKRSDSVNKRWSVKSNTGLKRGDSVAGGRPTSLHSRGLSRDIPSTRGDTPSSPLASSRPGSSHNLPSAPQADRSSQDLPETVTNVDNTAKPNTSLQERANRDTARSESPPGDPPLPQSPTKTMDPRRWSPTKSTWLESALQQKTEPPKLQPMKEEQPKWKVDLQRSKSRASRDVSPEKQPPKLDTEPASESTTLGSKKPQVSPPSVNATAFPGWSSASNPANTKTAKQESSASLNTTTPLKSTQQPSVKPSQVQIKSSIASEEQEHGDQKPLTEASKQPPALKPKPQTPPKTDFRSTLRSRAPDASQDAQEEPEFRSMFGKLKRTTTQNYVAPDELKTNILSGKAALNVTGGPVKTKRVDEFKESILAKKETMKSSGPKPNARPEPKGKDEEPIPEALARRKTLSKASAPDLTKIKSNPIDAPFKKDEKPSTMPKPLGLGKLEASKIETAESSAVLAVKESVTRSPKPPSKPGVFGRSDAPKTADDLKPTVVSPRARSQPASSHKVQPEPAKAIPEAGVTSIAPAISPKVATALPAASPSSLETTMKAGLPANSKLASRLNPNLAAMLSRGATPKPQSSPGASTEDLSLVTSVDTTKVSTSEDASLTHMTKGRAKGPKRRAPKVEAAATGASQPPGSKAREEVVTPSVSAKPEASSTKPVRSWQTSGLAVTKPASPAKAPLRELAQTKTPSTPKQPVVKDEEEEQVDTTTPSKARPFVVSKSPELRKVSSPSSIASKPASSPKPPVTPQKPSLSATPKASPKPSSLTYSGDFAEPQKPFTKPSPIVTKPAKADIVVKKEIKPIPQAPKPTSIQGLGLKMSPSPQASKPSIKPRVLTPPPDTDLKQENFQPMYIREVLQDYVGTIAKEHDKADFESQQFLTTAKQVEGKIKTDQHTVHEILGDGKRTLLPPQQQYILYEESMYLVTHRFSTENGSTTSEVHLWCGDRVADARLEDAQIFCRRDAREHNTKLEVVKQGKESANFIQAFGGILIIRRTKSSALYMLCGRRHLGHIVFDEVDMDSSNLCPGYTYLVSAPYGKLFLWKGKGAGADEVSSAKLIGTDLSLTGEIEEVDQDSEPSSFWDSVEIRKSHKWSDSWHQRAGMQGYPTTMYRVEHERPGMLTNIASWGLRRAASPAKQQTKASCERLSPFVQSDLETPAIHILDAYRVLYVILTRHCMSKAAEFVTALYLAQEFAMLSPAIQDRPVLPTCYVVAGELPTDAKLCFRKWSAMEATSLMGKDSICVRLEEAMAALDL